MTKPESPGTQITIIVDRKPLHLNEPPATGDALRDALALPADRDLFLDGKDGDDVLIEGSRPVEVHNGMKFFTAPRHITPGRVRW